MIDRKCKVTLGGLPQKIHVKGDETKPVLLFLHGGPGVCNRHTVMTVHADLQKEFLVVAWDQRGSGGSYRGAAVETLTIDRLVDDAHELVLWLCREYGRKRCTCWAAAGAWSWAHGCRYPGTLRLCAFGRSSTGRKRGTSYQFALDEAQKAGDEKSIAVLKRVGPPVMGVYKGGFDGMMAQRRVMMKYGGYSQSKKKRSYFRSMVIPMLCSGEYSIPDLIGVAKGYRYVLTAMWPAVGATDFPSTCTKFQVPYFIFDGVLDQNTPAALVQDYFDLIQAPKKELIWFEQSGHNPMTDEPERFKSLLRDRLQALEKEEPTV
ncbi:MAG: alpha/beta fold hydrolase [Ruthenibacterium lactatiformans]